LDSVLESDTEGSANNAFSTQQPTTPAIDQAHTSSLPSQNLIAATPTEAPGERTTAYVVDHVVSRPQYAFTSQRDSIDAHRERMKAQLESFDGTMKK
jgi:hypothetical protein